eukprot:6536772-Alexandrium_andersonii.AAC.1
MPPPAPSPQDVFSEGLQAFFGLFPTKDSAISLATDTAKSIKDELWEFAIAFATGDDSAAQDSKRQAIMTSAMNPERIHEWQHMLAAVKERWGPWSIGNVTI